MAFATILVRRGLDADRQNYLLLDGEFGWSNDTQELFMGDGTTLGGIAVGGPGRLVPDPNPKVFPDLNLRMVFNTTIGDKDVYIGDHTNLAYVLSGQRLIWHSITEGAFINASTNTHDTCGINIIHLGCLDPSPNAFSAGMFALGTDWWPKEDGAIWIGNGLVGTRTVGAETLFDADPKHAVNRGMLMFLHKSGDNELVNPFGLQEIDFDLRVPIEADIWLVYFSSIAPDNPTFGVEPSLCIMDQSNVKRILDTHNRNITDTGNKIFDGGDITIQKSGDPGFFLDNTGDTTATRTASIEFQHEGTTNAKLIARRDNGDADGAAFRFQTRPVSGSLTNAMVITQGQLVGIGVTNPDTELHLNGAMTFSEISTTPANPDADGETRVYVKADKLIVQYNEASTIRYKYLDLTGTGVTWTHTTTPP